eukprot:TRINITY_DN3175_c0_g1_i1.p1 TRINITY_DN3175_c0_g1~~TRINITY_DN3175_c0_g1_i1.p1  ORF type:complete len:1143 (+),score=187.69 TRINITY_DN3175_c0_g1_i1:48-3476(+)
MIKTEETKDDQNVKNSEIFENEVPEQLSKLDTNKKKESVCLGNKEIDILFIILCTGGLFGLFLLWNKQANFWFEKECNVRDCDKVLILSSRGDWTSAKVKERNGIKYFLFNGLVHIFEDGLFVLPPPIEQNWSHSDLLMKKSGLTSDLITSTMEVTEGKNIIDVPIKSLHFDFIHTFLQPSYIYVYLCCILWFAHHYVLFAAVIFLTSLIAICWDVYTRRKNKISIRDMARYSINVNVLRNNVWQGLSSEDLYPGDVVEVPVNGFKAPCDLVIVSGSAVVDESSLTGESIPIVKLPPEKDTSRPYSADKDRKHTIYSGTTVLGAVSSETDDKVLAVVARTGWKTAKGQLIRSILTVEQLNFEYEEEAKIFLGFLVVIGVVLFFYSLYLWGVFTPKKSTDFEGYEFEVENILFGFEAIAILVPPMLPALFHVGLILAARILQNEYRVFTTDPARIPLSGGMDVMCFDKTGTLTKDDLDMIGVVPVSMKLRFLKLQQVNQLNEKRLALMHSLVSCHQLGKLDKKLLNITSNEDSGNPDKVLPTYTGPTVDLKIFHSTGWNYHEGVDVKTPFVESPDGSCKLEILKRFEFDPAVQRMSAIVRDCQSDEIFAVCKGSPESFKEVCYEDTMPEGYDDEVKNYSGSGCYVLAIGSRLADDLDISNIDKITRQDVEREFDLRGLVLLRNELKPGTDDVISQLKAGNVINKIVTGDNIYTAFYIARKCGVIAEKQTCFVGDSENGEVVYRNAYFPEQILNPENNTISYSTYKGDKHANMEKDQISIGLTSAAFNVLSSNPEYTEFLVHRVEIFARMKPLQKEKVIKLIKESNYTVGMCGDGANDCAALSAAHCGVALSEAEASVVSPFTAKSLHVQSVVDLIKEGRACLANSFALFKFTVLYGIIQTTQALIAYTYGADLSQPMYIIIDFLIFAPCAFFIVKSRSSNTLIGDPPTMNVFGLRTLLSMFGSVILIVLSLELGIFSLSFIPGFEYTQREEEAKYTTPETTVVWMIGIFAYVGTAFAFSFGSRWRQSALRNYGLTAMVAVWLVLVNVLIWVDESWDVAGLFGLLELEYMPVQIQIDMMAIGWCLIILLLFYEKSIIIHIVDWVETVYLKRKKVGDSEINYRREQRESVSKESQNLKLPLLSSD